MKDLRGPMHLPYRTFCCKLSHFDSPQLGVVIADNQKSKKLIMDEMLEAEKSLGKIFRFIQLNKTMILK